MDIEKLKETLKANGVEEEVIDKVIADLEQEDEEEDKPLDEGKTEEEEPTSENEEPETEDETPSDEEDGAEKEEGETTPEEVVVPAPEEDVPPTELPTDVPVEEPVPQEPVPEEVAPVEEVPQPVVPQVDPDLLSKLEEQASTIEGLLARVDSLESALKQAGVLDASDGEEVGVDNPRVPATSSNGAIDDFDDALSYLNGKKRY